VLVPGLATAALVAAAMGDDQRALGYVRELVGVVNPFWRDYCLVWPARIAIEAGAPEIAGEFLERSTESPAAWNICARMTARAMLAEARGTLPEARALYREVADKWGEYGSVVERGYALLGLGRCGDADAAHEGREIFDRLGASPVLARAA
jgi:hypothetical protein